MTPVRQIQSRNASHNAFISPGNSTAGLSGKAENAKSDALYPLYPFKPLNSGGFFQPASVINPFGCRSFRGIGNSRERIRRAALHARASGQFFTASSRSAARQAANTKWIISKSGPKNQSNLRRPAIEPPPSASGALLQRRLIGTCRQW
jgi:hypothetical protein